MCKNLAFFNKNVVEFLAIEDGKKNLILELLFFSIGFWLYIASKKRLCPPITLCRSRSTFPDTPREVRCGVYNVFPVHSPAWYLQPVASHFQAVCVVPRFFVKFCLEPKWLIIDRKTQE
jgi:hypothetical protein